MGCQKQKKGLCSISRLVGKLFRYSVAMLVFHMVFNRNLWADRTFKASELIEAVSHSQHVKVITTYFDLCNDEITHYFFESRKIRRDHLSDIKQYAIMIFLSLHHKDHVINRCIEKIYTISTNPTDMNFESYKKEMLKALSGEYFELQFTKMYKSFSNNPDLSADKMKEIFYFMLDLIRDTDFSALKKLKKDVPKEAQQLIKKLYLTDSTYVKFGVEDEDILHAKILKKDKELQKMFSDIMAKVNK